VRGSDKIIATHTANAWRFGLKRLKWTAVAVFLLLLALGGVAWLVLPRFHKDDTSSSWTYRSPKHGFSMTLPSTDWKEIAKPGSDVAFHNRKHSVLVGINIASGQEVGFQKAIAVLRKQLDEGGDDFVSKPEFHQGVTDAGNPYAYCTVDAKSDRGGAVFVARSIVWCKSRALIVSVLMEGALAMESQIGKSAERDFYQHAVRTICLSAE
jgi:hypothetical protein